MEIINNSEQEKYTRAKKRVEELYKFYWNLSSYLVVIPFLIFINYMTSWGFQWFWYPLFGWGLGLALHAIKLFVLGTNWRDRKIREIMEQDNR
ncbi:2TM domain-containing protein [Ochrovirga pacifica]|uniref:2TM domain-containing protein n=1 Tax=Ochrovirga pacifica TaxID=1042376 RepID=UPI000255A7A5|nr:2TM domain-containing protein [Ochrovirga pacifica]